MKTSLSIYAIETAKILLKIQAVQLNSLTPFTWASGLRSPVYCNNRLSLSNVKERKFIKVGLAELIHNNFPDVEMIAGVATAGIAMGALIADELDLPYVYVRSVPKDHGTESQIEGGTVFRKKIVVFEDLISTGGSSLNVVDVLRNDDADIIGMSAVFTYGFEKAKKAFAEANVKLVTMTDYQTLLSAAVQSQYITADEQRLLENWSANPQVWSDNFLSNNQN